MNDKPGLCSASIKLIIQLNVFIRFRPWRWCRVWCGTMIGVFFFFSRGPPPSFYSYLQFFNNKNTACSENVRIGGWLCLNSFVTGSPKGGFDDACISLSTIGNG